MLVNDLFEKAPDKKNSLHNQREDGTTAELTDTRKTRLSLEQISRLRKLNDVKINEYHTNIKKIKQQFQPPAQPQ
jgi:hypothetical protein